MKKQSIIEIVIWSIVIICIWLLYSCGGARKTDLSRFETKTDNINIENSYTEVTKTTLGASFTYTPFDGLKPMIVDGKKFENAIVAGSTKKEYLKLLLKVKKHNITKTIVIEKTKTIDRTDNTMLWLGMFLIVVIAVWLWFYLPKIKK